MWKLVQILLQITELSECGSDPVWIWMQELVDEIIDEKLWRDNYCQAHSLSLSLAL